MTEPAPPAPAPAHEVVLVDHGNFLQPRCSCGWMGSGRRSRGLAREEARDHMLLYADAAALEDRPAE